MTQKTIKIDYTKPVSYKLIKDGYKTTKGMVSASDGMPKSLELDIPSEVYNTDLEYSVNVNVNGAPVITTNQFTLPDDEICEAKTYCYALKGKDYKYISKENVRHYDNFKIIGSPNITASGIASNFSVQNHLELLNKPTYIAGTIDSFELQFKVHTPTSENWTSYSRLMNDHNSYDGFVLEFPNNSREIVFKYGATDLITSNVTGLPDTDYWIRVTYDGSTMSILYALDGISYTEGASRLVSKSSFGITTNAVDIGARPYGDQNPECNWPGLIDLSETYIKVNNEYYWLPYRDIIEDVTAQIPGILDSSITTDNWQQSQEYKLYQLKNQNNTDSLQLTENSITDTTQKYKQYIDQITIPARDYKWYYFDQHNYTLIGDINYNKKTGIINNFSQDNYIHIQNILPEFNTFEMQIVFDYSRLPSTNATRLIGKNSQDIQCGLVLGINSGNGLTLWTSSNGNEWTASTSSSYGVSINTKTYLKIIFENSTYTVLVSTDKINWTTYITLNDNKFIQSQPFDIGSYLNNYLLGNIYINECYIKLDGALWWDPFYLNEWLTNKSYYTYNVNTDYSDTLDFSESYIGVAQNQYHKYVNQHVCLMPINGGETVTSYELNGTKFGNIIFNENTGILSNFYQTNSVHLNQTLDFTKSWEMQFKFTTSDDVASRQKLNGSIDNVDLTFPTLEFNTWTGDPKFTICLSSNGEAWDITDNAAGNLIIQPNTIYWVKFGWNETDYYVEYSLDGITYTRDITLSNSTPVYITTNLMGIGNDLYQNGYSIPFLGTIDLKECKIIVDNNVVWTGTNVITKLNQYPITNKVLSSNITVYGNPTIRKNLILTNPNNSNYLILNNVNINTNNYEACVKFKLTGFYGNGEYKYAALMMGDCFDMEIRKTGNDNPILLYTNGNDQWESTINGTFELSLNTWYWMKIVKENDIKTLYYSLDGKTWILDGTIADTYSYTMNQLYIGGAPSWSSDSFLVGSIDLKETYIKINSIEVPILNNIIYSYLPGCLYNYADEGNEHNFDVYYDQNYTQPVLVSTGEEYFNGTKVDTITIPKHNVWNYENNTWQKIIDNNIQSDASTSEDDDIFQQTKAIFDFSDTETYQNQSSTSNYEILTPSTIINENQALDYTIRSEYSGTPPRIINNRFRIYNGCITRIPCYGNQTILTLALYNGSILINNVSYSASALGEPLTFNSTEYSTIDLEISGKNAAITKIEVEYV